jgi:hypothetical protein
MLQFRKDQSTGNKPPSIDRWSNDMSYLAGILAHVSCWYAFPPPQIIVLIDGDAADFRLLNSDATIHIDSYTFAIVFVEEAVRDRVLADRKALANDYFETTP